MADPKIPPHIAKQIAAMKAAPAPAGAKPAAAAPAKGAAAAPAAKPKAPASPGSVMTKVAAVGWVLALLAGGAAYFIQNQAAQKQADALAAQAAEYDAKIAKIQADAAAQVKLAQDTAKGQLSSMQADLDFAKMPEIPLETVPRANQVLYVNNTAADAFTCKVKLTRPVGNVTKEVDFNMKGGTFQDMGAIGDWVFQKGDKLEFNKPGFKPRVIVFP